MIIYKVLLSILPFVNSELAEKFYNSCSEFPYFYEVKCPSEKPVDDYLECYDLANKEIWEKDSGKRLMYWCWSRNDNKYDDLKNLPISAAGYDDDNSEVNDIINRPFTARFYVNETHITCHDNEQWSSTIDAPYYLTRVYCPTSTGILVAEFIYYHEKL